MSKNNDEHKLNREDYAKEKEKGKTIRNVGEVFVGIGVGCLAALKVIPMIAKEITKS